MNKNKDILFYSNYCDHCKEFTNNLSKFPNIKQQLYLFCIDNNREKIPFSIKSVPSMITKDKKVLSGKDVFIWFENEKKNDTTDPLAWHNNEMGSTFSDGYSFLEEDTAAKGSGGSSIAHSFSFIDDSASINISNGTITTPKENTNNQKDILTKRMESLMENRDNELPMQVNRI